MDFPASLAIGCSRMGRGPKFEKLKEWEFWKSDNGLWIPQKNCSWKSFLVSQNSGVKVVKTTEVILVDPPFGFPGEKGNLNRISPGRDQRGLG